MASRKIKTATAKLATADDIGSIEWLKAKLAATEAKLAAATTKGTTTEIGLTIEVGQVGVYKGDQYKSDPKPFFNVRVYGLGTRPVTLYATQWMRLAASMPDLLKTIEEAADKLTIGKPKTDPEGLLKLADNTEYMAELAELREAMPVADEIDN